MIASSESLNEEPLFPNSQRIYCSGNIHKDIEVAMREISLSPSEKPNGIVEKNEPIRVYDTSGPWGDPNFKGDVTKGLPALRREIPMSVLLDIMTKMQGMGEEESPDAVKS